MIQPYIQIDWTHTIEEGDIESWEIERTDDPLHTPVPLATILFQGGISARYFDDHPLPLRNFYRVRGKKGTVFTDWSALAGPPLKGKIIDITATQIEVGK